MPLNDKQIAWLDGLAGKAAAGAQDAARAVARRGAQAVIDDRLKDSRDKIRATMEKIEIVDPGDGSVFDRIKAQLGLADRIRVLEPGGDPMKELDIWHDAKILRNLTDPQRDEIMKAMGDLMKLSAEMEAMTVDGTPDGERIYPADQPGLIANDLWQPLVREGVIPENFVPPRFSEVQTTFGAAAAMYEDRLKKESEEETKAKRAATVIATVGDFAKLGFEAGAAALQMTAGIEGAQAGIDGLKTLQDDEGFKALTEKAELLELIGAAISGVATGLEQAIGERDVVKSLDAVIVAVQKSILIGMGAKAGKDLSDEVGAIATAVVRAYPIAKKIARHSREDVDSAELINDLGELVASVGEAVASAMDAGGKEGGDFYKAAGTIIQGSFAGIAAGVKARKTPEDALLAIAEGAGKAATAISSGILGILKAEKTDEVKKEPGFDGLTEKEQAKKVKEATEIFDLIDKGITAGVAEAGALATAQEKLAKIMEAGNKAFDKSELDRLKKLAEAAQDAALKERMDAPDPNFEHMLMTGFSEDAYTDSAADGDTEDAARIRAEREERQVKSIEALIALQKKHEATYKLAQTIVNTAGKGTAAVLKNVIPGIGIAPVATQMVFSFYEAAKQGQQFLIWQENVSDASAAHTVQVEAMLNRSGLSKKQTVEAGIKAALDAAKLVGEVMKMGGHIAPAGYAVSAAASGSAVLLEIASKAATMAQMQQAWTTYRKAFEAPQDRKQARLSLQQNPTLAKYAMAYGAVTEGNRIAEEAMKRCGLNETTLADPGTNVKKVVTFLELRFKDDPVLLRAVPQDKAWYPGKVELTSSSWAMFVQAARTKAEPKLLDMDGSGVAAALMAFAASQQTYAAQIDDPAQIETGRVAAKAATDHADHLLMALARLKPRGIDPETEKETPHKEMAEYMQTLTAKVELIKRNIAVRLDKHEAAARQLAVA
jgi:hypothetical protein